MRRWFAGAGIGAVIVAFGVTALAAGSTAAWSATPPAAATPALVAPTAAPTTCSVYPLGKATITLSSSQIQAGATITVTGSNFLPGSTVTLRLVPGGDVLATVTVGSDGTFSVQVTIPASTPPGNYRIVATGRGCSGKSATTFSSLVVMAVTPPTTTTSKPLPFTGASVALPVGIGIGLLAVGLVAVLFGRRRPRTAGHS